MVTTRVRSGVAGRGVPHTDSWVTEQGPPARPIRHVWDAPVLTERTSVGLDELGEPLIPCRPPARNGRTGRPRVDNRAALEGNLFVAQHGIAEEETPHRPAPAESDYPPRGGPEPEPPNLTDLLGA